jgi:L-alanine-DL-glutamate epimerase-like enolase superfamily enzyme
VTIESAAPRIERLEASLLRVPLRRPYQLSFGDLEAFDTLLVELSDSDGRTGLGEATLLPAYSGESAADAWRLAEEWVEMGRSGSIDALVAAIASRQADASFVATAFLTAVDMLRGHASLRLDKEARVPLLALLNAVEPGAIESELDGLLAQGFRTIKVKVGLEGIDDLARVRHIQRANAGRARIRIDANQAFAADEAARLLAALDPQDIELFEQPCAAGDWDAHAAAAQAARVPLMLDESIFSVDDIARAADQGLTSYIKVKLVKFCSLSRLEQAIECIRARGLEPVLGNGVACDVGCWMETAIAARAIGNAGEMNGWLKPKRSLLANPLAVEDGCVVLPAGFLPVLDREAVREATVAACEVRPRASARV